MGTKMTPKTKPQSSSIEIKLVKIDVQRLAIPIIGDSPLICHRWSEKSREQMLAKQMKLAARPREAKNPAADYVETLYEYPGGGYGFPAVAFKSAAVDACSHLDGITKVQARGAFHVVGDLVKIAGEPNMREDLVRVGMGAADIRHRGEFKEWSTNIEIRFNAAILSAEQIIGLFNIAGFAIGVGNWRPEKNGSYGMFHVGN